MAVSKINETLNVVYHYLSQNYSREECKILGKELRDLAEAENISFQMPERAERYSYDMLQTMLASWNEKEKIRKSKGVYYTPNDVVSFILQNAFRLLAGSLTPDGLGSGDFTETQDQSFCLKKTVYDPTCGTGEFLLAALERKLDMLAKQKKNVTGGMLKKAAATIRGNDVNPDSVTIAKMRLFLSILNRYGADKVKGLAEELNRCFTSYDFVQMKPDSPQRYDVIVGNPPYVEDAKSGLQPERKYGNIYANVLEHAALHLERGGVMGFVIPLSYVATPRMRRIREELGKTVSEQYLLSYSDRPDCLFPSVHQKLCILLGRNGNVGKQIYTSNYQYWYHEERAHLFASPPVIKNTFGNEEFIPKLGTVLDRDIYEKVTGNKTKLSGLFRGGDSAVYLNMRAAFWIKAFTGVHSGGEYKEFGCASREAADYGMCLLNSSLFWWYWICVSDCWHITKKELDGFTVPEISDFQRVNGFALQLEKRLEETKKYVGTKQTEYEYKHRECMEEIHRMDDYIHELYGLTEEESLYIKNFAYRYRVSGGIKSEK